MFNMSIETHPDAHTKMPLLQPSFDHFIATTQHFFDNIRENAKNVYDLYRAQVMIELLKEEIEEYIETHGTTPSQMTFRFQ